MSSIVKKIVTGSAGLLVAAVLTPASALAASTFGDHLWQFVSADGTTTANVIDFNKGLSRIFDAGNLTLTTDDTIYLDAPGVVFLNNALSANSVTTRGGAHIGQDLSVGGTTSAAGFLSGNVDPTDGVAVLDKTRATGATGSFQTVAADLTYEGAAGGTGAFHAAVMGHFHGDDLTNSTEGSYHAGVIGAYSVTTDDDVTGPKAGVVGAVGVDDATDVPDAAVMAVLDGGDPGTLVTANAAYGVQYLNGNDSSKFSYGLNLSHAAVGALDAVSFSKADIRLSNGQEVYTGSATTRSAVRSQVGTQGAIGSIYLSSAGKQYLKVAAAGADTDWQKVTTTAAD